MTWIPSSVWIYIKHLFAIKSTQPWDVSLIKTSFSTIPGLFIKEKEVMNEVVGFTVK